MPRLKQTSGQLLAFAVGKLLNQSLRGALAACEAFIEGALPDQVVRDKDPQTTRSHGNFEHLSDIPVNPRLQV